MPPPGWLLDAFTVPLKAWISDLVSNFLYDLGYPVAQNGVMIMIGSYELMVKDACSGMNSIFALSAIGVFYVHEFVSQDWPRRVILILSIVPITILANFFRVLVLVLGAYYLGVDTIEGPFHDLTGIALFVFALVLFFLLDRVLIVAASSPAGRSAGWADRGTRPHERGGGSRGDDLLALIVQNCASAGIGDLEGRSGR